MKSKRLTAATAVFVLMAVAAIIWKTNRDLLPVPGSLTPAGADIRKVRMLDRNGIPLTVTYQNRWNIHDCVPLHEIPRFLQQAFIASEDKRFFEHGGVDWLARIHALWQNGKAMGAVRGASTISEQVVRMWHPRARSLWSRWLEGIEAPRLEQTFSKSEILEFYLNQVPYEGNRRGICQAARFYFDRDLDTLSRKEMLALSVMVRSPTRLNPRKNAKGVSEAIDRLLPLLQKEAVLSAREEEAIREEELQLLNSQLSVDAAHFVDFLYRKPTSSFSSATGQVLTTLDASLQTKAKTILDNRLDDLSKSGVKNGAAAIVDNRSHEVLAWINGGRRSSDIQGSFIDAAATPRQPGSTLKPFLYALALEKGWTAATLLNDSPLSEPVGVGLHAYHNYSRVHYGEVTLREALGNSLNIPAVRALQFVGVGNFLSCLHRLGMENLQQRPDFYGDGLALGNGEIALYELVQAYSVLANRGVFSPLKMTLSDDTRAIAETRVFSYEAASLIGDILSDASARHLEFGSEGLLHFPVQTAVKTGTSNDYRDAWAVGYTNRYTVGVWMGNLDRGAMDGISGSKGPAMVLRSIFTELNRNIDTEPLRLSPRLIQADICRSTGNLNDGRCISFSEWFLPGTEPKAAIVLKNDPKPLSLIRPSENLRLAMDPRIPDDREAFSFKLSELPDGSRVDWFVDNRLMATTSCDRYLWPVQRGNHIASARVRSSATNKTFKTAPVSFLVK